MVTRYVLYSRYSSYYSGIVTLQDKHFQHTQSEAFNNECRRLQKEKRENVHQMEKQFLIDQQNLIRGKCVW